MKKISTLIVFLTLIASLNTTFAQDNNIQYYHYKGGISLFMVTMDIIINNDTINGTYYYNRVGTPISISGTIKKNSFELKEFNPETEEITGTFTGTFGDKRNSISGEWEKADGSTKYNFSLKADYSNSSRIEFYSYNKTEKLLNVDDSPTISITSNYALPAKSILGIGFDSLSTNIKRDIFDCSEDTYLKCIEKLGNYLIEDYKTTNLGEDYTEYPYMFTWDFYNSTNLIFNDNNLLVLGLDTYEYTGGAHGLPAFNFLTYDIKTGKRITSKEIFKENTDDKLLELILKKMDENDITANLFSTEDVFVTDNIGANQYGIIFFYNVYEIAPYAVGPIYVEISYKELKSFLTQEFITRMKI